MKKFKSNIIKSLIATIILLSILSYVLITTLTLDTSASISLISALIALFAAVLAVLGLMYQLKSNNEWSKRQSALQEASKRESYSKAFHTLEKEIAYSNLKTPIDDAKMHEILCNNKNCTGEFLDLTPKGLEIRDSIFVILNYYEYLALGIQANIFDEDVIKKFIKGPLLNAYNIFSLYIKHLRTRHDRTKAFVELELLAQKWIQESQTTEFSTRESTV